LLAPVEIFTARRRRSKEKSRGNNVSSKMHALCIMHRARSASRPRRGGRGISFPAGERDSQAIRGDS